MNEQLLRKLLAEPIITVPPPKIEAVFGPAFRNTLILHENEIEEIVERVKKAQ